MKYISNIIRILFFALFIFLVVKGKMVLWLLLFAGSLIVAVVFGRVYCGYICPMNTLMIPTDWLSKKLKLQKAEEPKWLKNGYFPWGALVVSAAAMILSKKMLHIDLPILPLWLAVSFFVTLKYKPAVFHNLICPFGVLQKAFGRFAKISKKVNRHICIGCRLCESTCPSNAIEVSSEDQKADIKKSLCHQCSNCKEVCPTGAIYYGK